jgi:tetratricopeptide (TPR) repeat protein
MQKQAQQRERARRPNAGRTRLLWLATLATPLLLVGACEGLARLTAAPRTADDPMLQLVGAPSFFERTEIDGRPHVRVAHDEVYSRRNIVFATEKAPGSFRVFCLGGSASAGWPHPVGESYSAYLEQALRRSAPRQPIEVINVSAHAYAAYRVRLLFDRVLEFEPDLLVLYTGNNEFLEKRRYLPAREHLDPVLAIANRSAAVRLLRSGIVRLFFPDNVLAGARREHVAYEQWSKVRRVALTLRDDPAQFEQVKAHYELSVEVMVREAAARGVPVILVSVPVNLRDWQPNVSTHGLVGDSLTRWQTAFRAGRRALLQGDADAARERLEEAVALAPQHAESHYQLARSLERRGDAPRALAHYRRANDLDRNPFRALSDFNTRLRAIAVRHPNAHLADAESAFLAASAPRAPGFGLFLDYVHPTRRGNLTLARTVFDVIASHQLLGDPPRRRFEAAPSQHYDEARDLRLQRTLVMLFAMMHQYESLIAKAKPYTAAPADRAPFMHRAFTVFSDVVDLDRRRVLGLPVDPDEAARVEADLEDFYRERFPTPDESAADAARG